MKNWELKHLRATFIGSALVAALAAACGGTQAPAETAASEEAAPAEAAPAEEAAMDVHFDELSPPEKMQHMKKVVFPAMAKVFQEADAEKFAEFSCKNCHGPGASQGNFEMPNDSLPKLDQEEMAEHPEITAFMKERVVPEMAKLLGEEPYNMETHEGFGCYDCHMKKE